MGSSRKFILVLLAIFLTFSGICQESVRADDDGLPLREIALWIKDHIQFPDDAEEYGTVGTEQFVISTAWDGRVFISSPLHTLNPAFERAIKETVAQAPRCRLSEGKASDIYELVEIDFAAMPAASDKSGVIRCSRHTFPMFPKQKGRDDSREKFVEWLSARYEQSKRVESHEYADTVVLHYTISETGELVNPAVSECRDEQLRSVLEQGLRKSPRWSPAITANYAPIAVSVCERILVQADDTGKTLTLLRDDVCRNSTEAAGDRSMLVPNPEVKPRLQGEFANLSRLLADRIEFKAPTEYACSFVIERDGSVGELQIETTDENAGKAISEQIHRTCWTPAMQGGQAVRTSYYLHEKRGPKRETEFVYATNDSYPHFMTKGRYAPFSYDDKALQRRWKRFKRAYPEAAATIHGYSRFRKLDNLDYLEAMAQRNALQPTKKVRYKKSE